MKELIIMGIESSCDETSISIVKNGRTVLSNVINTQIQIHEKFGGVVPEIASRNHIDNISTVMKEAIQKANITLKEIDAIACTCGPGLVGALLVGVSYAKALSYSLDIPLVPVNHIEGHIAANYITHPELKPPFLCVMMSGGNTQLIHVKDYTTFEVLGKTRDDAIGEAFDKVARVLGLGYPGGPKVDQLAQSGTPSIELPQTYFEDLDFSFSGLKTAVINLHHKYPNINHADLAVSFEKTVSEVMINHTKKAIKKIKEETEQEIPIVLAGGVSANSYLRKEFDQLSKEQNLTIYYPELQLCTDNAAMIASAGYYEFLKGTRADQTLNAVPNLKLNEEIK